MELPDKRHSGVKSDSSSTGLFILEEFGYLPTGYLTELIAGPEYFIWVFI